MKIHLHIGTEKTGSSHLQTVSALNRELLQSQGVWFPIAQSKDDMLLKGNISAGNAQNITDCLKKNDFKKCKEIVQKHIIEAKSHNCNILYLSNELLISVLSTGSILIQFQKLLQSLHLQVEYLLIIRDPVHQALSLYKHRSKSGVVEDIKKWVVNNYHYSNSLLEFLQKAKAQKINLNCRKYFSKDNNLAHVLFYEWLKVQGQLQMPHKTVNPSLTLSELYLLKKIRNTQPYLVEIFYNKLLDIPKIEKAKNKDLEILHQQILANHLVKYTPTWQICNECLKNGEEISIPIQKQITIEEENNRKYEYSEKQLQVIADVLQQSTSVQFKLKVTTLKWRRKLGKLLKSNYPK